MELKDRARLAAEHYLKLSGRRIMDPDYLNRFIVVEDDEGIALVDVFYTTDNFQTKLPVLSRDVFEVAIRKFFMQEHEAIDVSVRYDTIELLVLPNERALVRHHVNAGLED